MTAATTPAHEPDIISRNIFKSMKDIDFEETISHQCGVTMNDRVEARAIAEVMGEKDGVTVTYQPAMIRIDGEGKLVFKMDEISEDLGREMTARSSRSTRRRITAAWCGWTTTPSSCSATWKT